MGLPKKKRKESNIDAGGGLFDVTDEQIDGLDLYDIHRKPRPITTDVTQTVSLPLGQFTKELQCPICLQLLTHTLTSMECLHRFCSECVNSSLRIGKKECPVCRSSCATRRSLRPDQTFDELIVTMYGDLDVYEENVTKMIMETTEKSCDALRKSFDEGLKRQEEVIQGEKLKRKRSKSDAGASQDQKQTSNSVSFFLEAREDYFDGKFQGKRVTVDGKATAENIRTLIVEVFFKKFLPACVPSPSSIVLRSSSGDEIPMDRDLFAVQADARGRGEETKIVFEKIEEK